MVDQSVGFFFGQLQDLFQRSSFAFDHLDHDQFVDLFATVRKRELGPGRHQRRNALVGILGAGDLNCASHRFPSTLGTGRGQHQYY